jgi:hypothetical protein
MDAEYRKKVKDLIEEHSIEDILEVYFEENCYGEVVQVVMSHVEAKLHKLSKIEEIFKE